MPKFECPWCYRSIEMKDAACPHCGRRIAAHDGSRTDESDDDVLMEQSIENMIEQRFKCGKCGSSSCATKEVAMTGSGLSKLFDIQYNHYLFVSCTACGFVEVFNPSILEGKTRGELGTVLDLFFG